MPYSCGIDLLLESIRVKSPKECDALNREKQDVENGLLSVGLKVHVTANPEKFLSLIWQLGGATQVFGKNVYKLEGATFCLVLPPLGSAQATIRLVRCIERYTECSIFGNPDIQLQVCSPGRLSPRRAAILAIMFYLASDTLRRYSLRQFASTVSYDNRYNRGRRIVIYDAGAGGGFERNFEWWERTKEGRIVRAELPFDEPSRSDIIAGTSSPEDIENINLLATLLVHSQFSSKRGYWYELGVSLESDVHALLDKHLLTGLLEAPWVHEESDFPDVREDQIFFSAIQELTAYALEEAERLTRGSRFARMMNSLKPGILEEAHSLLQTYRSALNAQAELHKEGGAT